MTSLSPGMLMMPEHWLLFARIENYFNFLTHQGSEGGYHPGPSKNVLIMHPENIDAGKEFGDRHGFMVCTGTHYIGGYTR